MPQALTPFAIENLKATDRRLEIPDAKARGLHLIIQPSGRKSFAVRYRFNGKPKKLTLRAGVSLAAARKAAADALFEVEQGRDPSLAKRERQAKAALRNADTLRAIVELYLKREEAKPLDRRLRTVAYRRATFTRLIYPVLGDQPIGEIKRSDIVRLIDRVEAERGGRMADECLCMLRIAMNFHAKRDDDFRSPIVKGMTLTRPQDRVRNRVLTDAEVVKLWNAAEAMDGVGGLYTQFLLLTACRRNEAAQATWDEITGGDWLIPSARYKSKRDHLIPLSGAAQAILAKVPRFVDCNYAFTTGKHALAGFSALKKKLETLSGVTNWRLHDLRRTARSMMSAAGCNPDHAERCLGHALPGIRKVYDHFGYRAEKLAAFEALAAHINRLVNPPAGGNVVELRGRHG